MPPRSGQRLSQRRTQTQHPPKRPSTGQHRRPRWSPPPSRRRPVEPTTELAADAEPADAAVERPAAATVESAAAAPAAAAVERPTPETVEVLEAGARCRLHLRPAPETAPWRSAVLSARKPHDLVEHAVGTFFAGQYRRLVGRRFDLRQGD